jgi:nucleoside-diphosphate-sugar epimerase
LVSAATAAGVGGSIINIGSGDETSINGLIATLGQVTRRQPDVIYNPQESGGIARLVADLTRARQLLGYQPRVPLMEGLQRLLVEDPRFRTHKLT